VSRLPRVCIVDGCPEPTTPGTIHCPAHPPKRSPSSIATSQPGWRQLRQWVLERDRYVCQLCGEDGADTVDHILSAAQGGGNSLDNCQAAHRACNRRKGG
jgi:5-methylcytosine-specific restriction endonuclease McrA